LIENNEVVDPSYCANIEKPVSNDEIPCKVSCFKWQYSEWSDVINENNKKINQTILKILYSLVFKAMWIWC